MISFVKQLYLYKKKRNTLSVNREKYITTNKQSHFWSLGPDMTLEGGIAFNIYLVSSILSKMTNQSKGENSLSSVHLSRATEAL